MDYIQPKEFIKVEDVRKHEDHIERDEYRFIMEGVKSVYQTSIAGILKDSK